MRFGHREVDFYTYIYLASDLTQRMARSTIILQSYFTPLCSLWKNDQLIVISITVKSGNMAVNIVEMSRM